MSLDNIINFKARETVEDAKGHPGTETDQLLET